MVVSFDIYEVLCVVDLVACLVQFFFIFFHKDETWTKVVRLVLVSGMVLINIFQIPMEISMDKSYGWSITLAILWFINALWISFDLGQDC